jgi:DHA3 family macrolide efflux protein-like MFS transporter
LIGVQCLTDSETLATKMTSSRGIDQKEIPSTREVLKNTSFMLLFAAQFTQNVGAAVSSLAISYYLLILTGSKSLMGILQIVYWIPFVVFTPFAGVFVDRLDQRKIMLLSNVISFIASLGFVLIYLFRESLIVYTGITTIIINNVPTQVETFSSIHIIWPLLLLTFLNSTSSSLFFPARNAYTRLIVKKKNLLIANSIGSTVFQIATIVGYVLAGLLAGISYLYSFIFDASTFLFSLSMIILIIFIGKKPPKVIREKSTNVKMAVKGVYDDLRIGFRTIRERPKISYMLMIFATAIFAFSAFNILIIVIVQNEMGLNETAYGILQALMGTTGIITAIYLMNRGKIDNKIKVLNVDMVFLTVIMYFFAFTRNVWAMGVILAILGISLVFINIPATTLIQEQIPYEKQGRVFGTQQLVQGIARLIGMGVVTLVADYLPTQFILLGSAILLTLMCVFGFLYSSRRGIMTSDYDKEGQEIVYYDKKTTSKEFLPSIESKK